MQQQDAPASQFYDAFISYARTPDQPIARALRKGLHRLGRKAFQRRAVRVFLDEAALEVGGALSERITEAIESSSFFILLASPGTAARPWVDHEVAQWLTEDRLDRLTIVLTGGTIVWDSEAGRIDPARTTALPPSLLYAFEQEPLWLDLTWARQTEPLDPSEPGLVDAIARLSARIRGIPLDEVIGADLAEQQRLNRLKNGAIALLLLSITAVGFGLYARWQQGIATRNAQEARLRATVATARASLSADPIGALRLARDALMEASQTGVVVHEAQSGAMSVLDAARERRKILDPTTLHSERFRPIRAVSVAPHSETVLVATVDLAHLVDPGGRPVAPPVAGPDWQPLLTNNAAWSPSGEYFAIASGLHDTQKLRGTGIHIFTADGTSLRHVLTSHDAPLTAVAFLSNDAVIAGDARGRIFLATFEQDAKPRLVRDVGSSIADLAVLGPERLIVYGTRSEDDSPWVAVTSGARDGLRHAVDVSGSTVEDHLLGDVTSARTRSLTALTVSPDRTLLAAAGADGVVAIWRWDGGASAPSLAATLKGHVGAVTNVAFSADGSVIATSGADGSIRLWGQGGAALTPPLLGHGGAVRGLAFINDGAALLSGGDDGILREWDVSEVAGPTVRSVGRSASADISTGCGLIAAGLVGKGVQLFDLQGAQRGGALEDHGDRILLSIALSSDCKTVASAGGFPDGVADSVFLSDNTGEALIPPLATTANISTLAFSSDGRTIAVANGSIAAAGIIRLIDKGGDISEAILGGAATPDPPANENEWISFTRQALSTMLEKADISLQFFGSSGRLKHVVAKPHEDVILAIAASPAPSGSAFATGGADHFVRFWTADGQLAGDPIDVMGELAVVGDSDAVPLPFRQVTSLAHAPTGDALAVGLQLGTPMQRNAASFAVRILDLETGTLGEPLVGHEAPIDALAFSPDGSVLASGGGGLHGGTDFSVRLWSRDGRPLGSPRLGHRGSVVALGFTQDGQRLLSVGREGTLRSWTVSVGALLEVAGDHLGYFERKSQLDALKTRALAAEESSDDARALALLAEATRLDPEDASLYWKRANLRPPVPADDVLGRWDSLVAGGKRVQTRRLASLYEDRGEVRAELGRHAAAEADFTKAIALGDDEATPMRYERGVARFHLGRFAEAEADFTKAIDLGDRDLWTIQYRAQSRMELGDFANAMADLNWQLELDPKDSYAYDLRAEVKNRTGWAQEDIDADCLKSAEIIAPEPPDREYCAARFMVLSRSRD